MKVEFAERGLGESVKVDCVAEKPTEINFQTKINVTFEDPLILDELVSRPVVCTYSLNIIIIIYVSGGLEYVLSPQHLGNSAT